MKIQTSKFKVHTSEGEWNEVEGYEVFLPGIEKHRFFIHPSLNQEGLNYNEIDEWTDDLLFTCSEVSTGSAVTQDIVGRGKCHEAALNLAAFNKQNGFDKAVADCAERVAYIAAMRNDVFRKAIRESAIVLTESEINDLKQSLRNNGLLTI